MMRTFFFDHKMCDHDCKNEILLEKCGCLSEDYPVRHLMNISSCWANRDCPEQYKGEIVLVDHHPLGFSGHFHIMIILHSIRIRSNSEPTYEDSTISQILSRKYARNAVANRATTSYTTQSRPTRRGNTESQPPPSRSLRSKSP